MPFQTSSHLKVVGSRSAEGAGLSWWDELQDSIAAGKHCIGLTFNTDDYVFSLDEPPRSLLAHLDEHLERRKYDIIIHYSVSRGIEIFHQDTDKESKFRRYSGLALPDVNNPSQQTVPPSVVLKGLDRLLRQDTIRVAVILTYGHHIAPAMQASMASVSSEDQIACVELMHAWGLDDYFNKKTQNVVIALLREGYYNDAISEHWKIIRIDMPDALDLERFYTFLDNLNKQGRKEFAPLEAGISIEAAAMASSGLRLRSIEEMCRVAAVHKHAVSLPMIKQAKGSEIRRLCEDVLEVLETNITLDDIAGLEHVKRYYQLIVSQVRRGYRNIPRAFLLAGPPGCGKSYQIRALASALGWNCVMMRAVRSMWVGESERNLERALNTVSALRPVVLFMDEVDQMLGQRGQGGDSGVSERILARLWEFMALEEHRGRLLFVAATNRPDMLDPATVDRFSTVIPILQPSSEEFAAILPKVAQQVGRSFAGGIGLDGLGKLLRQKELSTRQVVDVVSMAALKNDQVAEPGSPLTEKALLDAAKSFRSNHNPFQIEMIVLQAIRMTTFNDLLPWSSDPARFEFPDYLRRVMDENFEIDIQALERRIEELRRHLAVSRMIG